MPLQKRIMSDNMGSIILNQLTDSVGGDGSRSPRRELQVCQAGPRRVSCQSPSPAAARVLRPPLQRAEARYQPEQLSSPTALPVVISRPCTARRPPEDCRFGAASRADDDGGGGELIPPGARRPGQITGWERRPGSAGTT